MKPLEDRISPKIASNQGLQMLFYRAALSLSRQTLSYVAGVIGWHRRAIGSPWRLLSPTRQALLVLVHLRKGETLAELATGFAVSIATAWRYMRKTVDLLAVRALSLGGALRSAGAVGYAYLILDGTLISIDRLAADRPFYSGKHRCHGMNVQVISAPDGSIVWVSGSLSGKIHNLRAARIWGAVRLLVACGLLVCWPTMAIRAPASTS